MSRLRETNDWRSVYADANAALILASKNRWQDRTPYDPARHRALQQHCTVTIPATSGSQPDLAATERMLDAAVTGTAARRAERKALDGKPKSATTTAGG